MVVFKEFCVCFLTLQILGKKNEKKTVFYIDYEFFFTQIIAPLFLMKNIQKSCKFIFNPLQLLFVMARPIKWVLFITVTISVI